MDHLAVFDQPLGTLPLAPLAPVLWSEVKTLGINAQVSFVHRSFVSFHNVLRERQDVLTLNPIQNDRIKDTLQTPSRNYITSLLSECDKRWLTVKVK